MINVKKVLKAYKKEVAFLILKTFLLSIVSVPLTIMLLLLLKVTQPGALSFLSLVNWIFLTFGYYIPKMSFIVNKYKKLIHEALIKDQNEKT